jgi:galactokinase
LIPFGSGERSPVVVVTNSNVKHKLSDGEYPVRVKQCKEAVSMLQMKYPAVKALRDCTGLDQLDAVKGQMSEVIYRRAKHCVTEDARTLRAVEALAAGDFKLLGKLMTESHMSLKNDYEVSCAELDALVDSALEVEGVYGSRMTGGGFGGCTVTLVDRSAAARLIEHQKEKYFLKHREVCDCYIAAPSAGAGVIDLTDVLAEYKKKVAGKRTWVLPFIAVTVVVITAIVIVRKK